MPTYGSDLSCVSDLDPSMVEVSEDRAMLQSMARRVNTDRGAAIDAPDDGINVKAFLSASITPSRLASLQMLLRNEFLKDERVFEVDVDVAFSAASKALTIRAIGLGADGPFRLTIGVSAATVELLET